MDQLLDNQHARKGERLRYWFHSMDLEALQFREANRQQESDLFVDALACKNQECWPGPLHREM